MRLFTSIAVVLVLLGSVSAAAAQSPGARSGSDDAQMLARGWTALAGGKAVEAERIADAMLKASPRQHDALGLKIRSRLLARNAVGVTSALDAYEAWLGQVRQREDVSLLEPIATGLLDALATSVDPAVRARALGLLAAAGDQDALARLQATSADPGAKQSAGDMPGEVELARLGDARAVQRLAGRIKDGAGRDVSDAIDALVEARATNATAVLVSALDPGRPLPTRLAAARALGALGNDSALPRLREAMKDPDPPVRVLAAAALARLGDPAGAELLRSLENSPVGDLRLLAVEASASTDPTGAWVAVATGVLKDPDPLVRLRAAELLLQHASDPGDAAGVFSQALDDPNPAMRDAAGQRLRHLPAAGLEHSIPRLRTLLRSPSALTQVEAAGSILRIAGAIE
jgi:HEAT repeat protein